MVGILKIFVFGWSIFGGVIRGVRSTGLRVLGYYLFYSCFVRFG